MWETLPVKTAHTGAHDESKEQMHHPEMVLTQEACNPGPLPSLQAVPQV